jgi:hypothetical protein
MPSQKGGGLFSSNTNSLSDSYSYPSETGVSSGIIQYLYYFIVLTIIIVLILVLVNYTLYPIFRTTPGGKGVIPIPGTDDSGLFWKTSNTTEQIQDSKTPVGTKFENWSYMLDIQVDNPTSNTDTPRILLLRGENIVKNPTPYTDSDTILKIAPNFNTAVYLDRLTNDLYVSVQTSMQNTATKQTLVESVLVPNIPVRKAIRLGVMVGSKVLEVYVNGYLLRSKTFTDPLRAISGSFYPPSDPILSNTARVQNLRIWNRPLNPAEFRSYGLAVDLPLKDLPDSCAAVTDGISYISNSINKVNETIE